MNFSDCLILIYCYALPFSLLFFQTFLLNLQMVVFCTHMGLIPPFLKKKLKQRFGLVFSIDSEEGFTSSTYTSHVEKCPRA